MQMTNAHTKFKNDLVEIMENEATILQCQSNQMQGSGWPDLHVDSRKWCGWIEVKVDKDYCKALQRKKIRELAARGANVIVVHLDTKLHRVSFETCYGVVVLKIAQAVLRLHLFKLLADLSPMKHERPQDLENIIAG